MAWFMREREPCFVVITIPRAACSIPILMTTALLPPILMKQRRDDAVRGLFQAAVKAATRMFKTAPQIVWMVNFVSDAHAYGDLKLMTDTEAGMGIVSQCMLSKRRTVLVRSL